MTTKTLSYLQETQTISVDFGDGGSCGVSQPPSGSKITITATDAGGNVYSGSMIFGTNSSIQMNDLVSPTAVVQITVTIAMTSGWPAQLQISQL
jgi:hypothetical protein